jgi:acetyl-CoA carboxylase carboxyl transferase subunit alpha
LILEPPGGAHQHYYQATEKLKEALLACLKELQRPSLDELLEERYRKYRLIGAFGKAQPLSMEA